LLNSFAAVGRTTGRQFVDGCQDFPFSAPEVEDKTTPEELA
jgi:hypothetical protein